MTTTTTKFFVVDRPGTYGDIGQVYSAHRTLAAAKKQEGPRTVVRAGGLAKGDRWLRVYEEIYPLAS